ncbi:hypothetical protein LINPERPRIM_LOCUS42112 [Linum perenne]
MEASMAKHSSTRIRR